MNLFDQLPEDKPKKDGLESIRKIMSAFAFVGAPPELITMLLEFGGLELSADHRRFLNGPIIQQKSAFADLTPKWMFGMVAGERLEIILQEQKEGLKTGWKVGPTELATALYPASHDAPMLHEYAEIYIWASTQACAKYYHKPREYFAKVVGGLVVKDSDVIERGGRYFQTYQELCQTIRNRVVSVQSGREKVVKSKTKDQNEQPPETGGVGQLSLF